MVTTGIGRSASPAARLDGVRSMLFVPAGREKLVASAARRSCDGFILDLEDGVPADGKDHARQMLSANATELKKTGALVGVRVNRPWTLMLKDLEATVAASTDFVMLPKIEAPHEIEVVGEMLDELEAGTGVGRILITQIETATGICNMPEIARAKGARHAAMMLGPEDLALDLNALPNRAVMQPLGQSLVVAARSGGLVPVGSPGSVSETKDMQAYREQILLAKEMGFGMVVAIHPTQLDVIHAVFQPTAAEAEWAKAVVAANEAAGGKPFLFEGRMVDAPIVARARSVLRSVPTPA